MENNKYDFLIVGAGLYGATFAYEASKIGKKCLVIEKRNHIGGNIYCENIESINVHKYGAHIFHTNNKIIWDYVNELVEFNRYTNSPIAIFEDKLYNLPFNMNTFYQLWGTKIPIDAINKINEQTRKYANIEANNLEEMALKLVGEDIYFKLIKGYTEKQWGRDAKEIPSFIIKRIPLRFNFDNNYFNDKFQGIPIGGYNILIQNMLKNSDILLNTDFFENKEFFLNKASKIIYTGMIDKYYDYCFGELEYRSLRFENEILNTNNFQGNAVVNYTDKKIPYTRIIEHKYFEFGSQEKTIITKEYPVEFKKNDEAYYPINDNKNTILYQKYYDKSKLEKNIFFGGRLAEYKYYDMHNVIECAIKNFKEIISI